VKGMTGRRTDSSNRQNGLKGEENRTVALTLTNLPRDTIRSEMELRLDLRFAFGADQGRDRKEGPSASI